MEDSDDEDEDEDARRYSLGRPPSIHEMAELPTKEGYLMMRGMNVMQCAAWLRIKDFV